MLAAALWARALDLALLAERMAALGPVDGLSYETGRHLTKTRYART